MLVIQLYYTSLLTSTGLYPTHFRIILFNTLSLTTYSTNREKCNGDHMHTGTEDNAVTSGFLHSALNCLKPKMIRDS